MMTGRDLIIYILENGQENEPICKDGRFLGFMTHSEAAAKFGVGMATVEVWVHLGQLEGVVVGQELYIPANAESPLSKGDTDVKTSTGVLAVFGNSNG